MLILSLAAVGRAPVRLQEQIAPEDPLWQDTGIFLQRPLRVDLEGRSVGEGVLVRGEIDAELDATCRRCLSPTPIRVRDTVDLLYEPLSAEDEAELSGEVLPAATTGASIYSDESRHSHVFLTDRLDEAKDWAQFAHEMTGEGSPRVYAVSPAAKPKRFRPAESKSDGTKYREFIAPRATVLGEVWKA